MHTARQAHVMPLLLAGLFFGKSAQCFALTKQKVAWDKSIELKLARREFVGRHVYLSPKILERPALEGFKESIDTLSNLQDEREGTVEAAYLNASKEAGRKNSRQMLAQSFSRREKLQGRTKEMAREQRWARAKNNKQARNKQANDLQSRMQSKDRPAKESKINSMIHAKKAQGNSFRIPA